MSTDPTTPPAAPATTDFRLAPAGGDGAAPPTTVVGGAAGDHDPSYISVRLPPVLAELFDPIEELGSGGQATVVRCRRRAAPEEEVAIKVYRTRSAPTEVDPRESFRDLSADHVVTYVEPYFGSFNNYRWEVQEYLSLGNLRDFARTQGGALTTAQIHQVVTCVTDALDHVHSRKPRIIHRDIKPENFLLRAVEPLHVVLADFGLAVLTELSHEQHSGSRTDAYAAPEAPSGETDAPLDWWSLGMTIAELAAGRHPYTLADGRFMNPRAISAAIATRPVPLDGIEDERIRMLLQGLLTRDPEHRWRATQVRQWLAGESPAVAAAETASDSALATTASSAVSPGASSADRVDSFPFMGRTFTSADELGAAIVDNWGRAGAMIAGRDLARLVQWVEQHYPERSIADVARDFERERSTTERDVNVLVARIAIRLNPDGEPVFMGETIDMASIAEWATRINTDAGRHLRDVVEWLFHSRLLLDYRRFAGNGDLAHVEETWQDLCDSAQAWFRQVPEAGTLTPEVRALILRVAVAKVSGVDS